MKCIDPLVTGYERGTFEERSARTELLPRQSGKNSEDDYRANNNIRETLGILSLPTMAPNGIKMYLGLKWPLDWRLRLASPPFDEEYHQLVQVHWSQLC